MMNFRGDDGDNHHREAEATEASAADDAADHIHGTTPLQHHRRGRDQDVGTGTIFSGVASFPPVACDFTTVKEGSIFSGQQT